MVRKTVEMHVLVHTVHVVLVFKSSDNLIKAVTAQGIELF